MTSPPRLLILGSAIICVWSRPSFAQGTDPAPVATSATTAHTSPPGQAPDGVIKELSALIHAEKYSDARQVVAGLLTVYPDDARLIKAKALLAKVAGGPGSAAATPRTAPRTEIAPSAQPAATMTSNSGPPTKAPVLGEQPIGTTVNQLTGKDRVEYDALIELGRQAQQTTDLSQQTKVLQQFMAQSGVFLKKHPTEVLIWQLRAASAIGLHDRIAGFEAGQRLLAMGIADSSDPNSRRVLVQLKNKGWLTPDTREMVDVIGLLTDCRGEEGSFNLTLRASDAAYAFEVLPEQPIPLPEGVDSLCALRGRRVKVTTSHCGEVPCVVRIEPMS